MEARNDKSPGVPERANPSIEAEERHGTQDSGLDLCAAVSLYTVQLAILPLVVRHESQPRPGRRRRNKLGRLLGTRPFGRDDARNCYWKNWQSALPVGPA